MEPLRRHVRRETIVIGAVVALVVIPLGVMIYQAAYTLRGIPDAYAKWDAATLLIDHMETYDGKWPRSWDDLRDSYDRVRSKSMLKGGQTFDEIRERVGIDWTVDPGHLVTGHGNGSGERPFHVVWAVSGNNTVWSGAEPNGMLLDYLRERPTTRPSWSAAG